MLEMMLVIMVVALLFLLTIPNIHQVMTIVQKKGCEAQLSVIDAAILQYFMIHDQYPITIDQMIEQGLLTDAQRTCQNGKTIEIIENQAALP